jgi:hypothetical protein
MSLVDRVFITKSLLVRGMRRVEATNTAATSTIAVSIVTVGMVATNTVAAYPETIGPESVVVLRMVHSALWRKQAVLGRIDVISWRIHGGEASIERVSIYRREGVGKPSRASEPSRSTECGRIAKGRDQTPFVSVCIHVLRHESTRGSRQLMTLILDGTRMSTIEHRDVMAVLMAVAGRTTRRVQSDLCCVISAALEL